MTTETDDRPVILVKVHDVARAYRVHPRSVLRMVKRGDLRPVPVPGMPRALRFDPSVLPPRRPAA